MSELPARQRAGQGGFTLIELLVVVLVIGILASIAIPAFLGQRRKAQNTAAMSLIRSGVIASESYYAESANQNFNGMIPSLLADQEQNVAWTTASAASGGAEAVADEIQVVLFGTSPNEDSYALASRSKTGTVFVYLRTPSGASYRCSGVAGPLTAAIAPTGCTGTYAGSW